MRNKVKIFMAGALAAVLLLSQMSIYAEESNSAPEASAEQSEEVSKPTAADQISVYPTI